MLNKLNKMRKNAKGFTLVELIVVIIIIAVLAAVAIPAVNGFQDSARKSRIRSEHRQLVSAVQSYYGDHADDEDPMKDITIDALYSYVAKQKDKDKATDALAKNGDATAHSIIDDQGVKKLKSEFISTSGTKDQTWEYDITSTYGK